MANKRFIMSLRFYYIRYPNESDLVATIISDDSSNLKEEMIISYLIDDGGLSVESHIEYLDDCISKLENSIINEIDISSNSYGVELINEMVKIYFLYDENQCCEVKRSALLKLLKSWVMFIKKNLLRTMRKFIFIIEKFSLLAKSFNNLIKKVIVLQFKVKRLHKGRLKKIYFDD